MLRILTLLIFVCFTGLSVASAQCTISDPGSYTELSLGSLLRNPGAGGERAVLTFVVDCPTSTTIEFRPQNSGFAKTTNASTKISYLVSTNNGASRMSPPGAGAKMTVATIPAGSSTVSLQIYPTATSNLLAGTYSESVTLIAGDGTPNFASRSAVLTGSVPDDCAVSLGSMPNDTVVGDVVKSPASDSFSIPLTATCNTYQANVGVRVLNGALKGVSPSNTVQVPYSVTLDGAFTGAVTMSASQLTGDWVTMAVMPSQTVMGSIRFQPNTISNLPPDMYKDTIYIRVNGP